MNYYLQEVDDIKENRGDENMLNHKKMLKCSFVFVQMYRHDAISTVCMASHINLSNSPR